MRADQVKTTHRFSSIYRTSQDFNALRPSHPLRLNRALETGLASVIDNGEMQVVSIDGDFSEVREPAFAVDGFRLEVGIGRNRPAKGSG